ncbi:MAG: DUF192 domain-containing protein [Candidatus Dormibacteraceae bacterium]
MAATEIPAWAGVAVIDKLRLQIERSGQILAERLIRPKTVWGRGIGLMFRRQLAVGTGMWLNPCNGIHMFFMRFAIDAVFLDRRLEVVHIVPELRPWRMVPWVVGAHSVIELPAGRVAEVGLVVGDRLALLLDQT